MEKKKVFTRKRVTGALSVILVVALLLGGTYAWTNFDLHKTNGTRGGERNDVTLNDAFTPPEEWEEGQTIDKKVSVTNPRASTDPVYVRLQFKEYFEMYEIELVNNGSLFATYADGPNKGEFMTWADAEAGGYDYTKYAVTYADGSTEDFALTQNAEIRDGIYGKAMYIPGELKVFSDTDTAPTKAPYPDQDHAPQSADNLECKYPVHIWGNCDIGEIGGTKKIDDYISWTLGEYVKTMDEWVDEGRPAGDFWILDTTDGWAYWANAIGPNNSTENIMESITLDNMPGANFEYYIHIDMEAVSFDDLDTLASKGTSADGQDVIDMLKGIIKIDNPEDKFDAGNDVFLKLKPVPEVPGGYEVLGDDGKSQSPVQYIYDPDGSIADDKDLNGDEITMEKDADGYFVTDSQITNPANGRVPLPFPKGETTFVFDTTANVSSSDFGLSNENLILQIGPCVVNNYTVDWGDGSEPEENATEHTYASSGTYNVTITGLLPGGITFNKSSSKGEARLIEVNGSLLPMVSMSAANIFNNCKNLKTISASLFSDNPQITSFAGTFATCSSLTSIPEALFANNTEATSFNSTFSTCHGLTSIPEKLFANNKKVTSFSYAFGNCDELTASSIPTKLFAENTEVTTFAGVLQECDKLDTVPAGLFDNNKKVTTFAGLFVNCISFASIPEGLFDNNTAVTAFNSVFQGCSKLGTIPLGLFDNNTKVTNFSYAFNGCASVTAIPLGLFDNNTKVTTFATTFTNCNRLALIPSGLFDNNELVTNFYATFLGCTGLHAIPARLFDKNTEVTNFNSTFQTCTAINTAIPAWWDTANYPTGTYPQFGSQSTKTSMFTGCNSATNIGSVPSGWK
jgi:hypothetical protein